NNTETHHEPSVLFGGRQVPKRAGCDLSMGRRVENFAATLLTRPKTLFFLSSAWVHEALRTTPAVALGITDHVWSITHKSALKARVCSMSGSIQMRTNSRRLDLLLRAVCGRNATRARKLPQIS